MDEITLSGIRIYTNHGCLDEESRIGSEYEVSLTLYADLSAPAHSDRLKDTVDYVRVNRVVKEEMERRSKLLEHVCQRIMDRLLRELPQIRAVSVSVSKLNPPIFGDVDRVTVKMQSERS